MWQSSLTVAKSNVLEYLQTRAINIIFSVSECATIVTIVGIYIRESQHKQLTKCF